MFSFLFELLFRTNEYLLERKAAQEKKRREDIEASDKAIREELEAAERRKKLS